MSLAESKRALQRQLRVHRLDHSLTFRQLRDDIEKVTGVRMSPPTLVRFIENERATQETNVHAIRRYLAAYEEPDVLINEPVLITE